MLAALSAGEDYTGTLLNNRKDGAPFWNDLALSPLRDDAGQITNWVSVHTDVSARVEAEQQRETRAQNEKLRALGQMASGIAHDLNQSLGLIAGYGDLASRAAAQTPLDVEALGEALPIIVEAAINGGESVRRLLSFAGTKADGKARVSS
jgi:C4-dicarboxylate-specific signal transduction histidine kinase